MVRDIRVAERWMGTKDLYIDKSIDEARVKLERSIATKRAMKAGETIVIEDIHMLSPGDGFKWKQVDEVIGKTVVSDIAANEIIYPNLIK